MSKLKELISLFKEETTGWAKKEVKLLPLKSFLEDNWRQIISFNLQSFYDSEIILPADYLFYHSLGVGLLAGKIALAMELNKKQIIYLIFAGLLHDIAFFFDEEKIYFKEKSLDEKAKKVIYNHPEDGMIFLLNYDFISTDTLNAIYEHHERLDGSGYPRGLKGGQIGLGGRIIAVSDVYDALRRKHLYRDAQSGHQLWLNLGKLSRRQLDKEVLKKVLEFSSIYPPQTQVLLSNGEKAIVEKKTQNPFRPVVKLFEDGRIVDLTEVENWNLYVEEVL